MSKRRRIRETPQTPQQALDALCVAGQALDDFLSPIPGEELLDNKPKLESAIGLCRAYKQAAINLVRLDKLALSGNRDVARVISMANMQGDKEFFQKLGSVLATGVGLDKRLERDLLEWLHLAKFRASPGAKGRRRSFGDVAEEIADRTGKSMDEAQVRRKLKRRGLA